MITHEISFQDGEVKQLPASDSPREMAFDGPWKVRFPHGKLSPHGKNVPLQQMFDSLRRWTEATRLFTYY